MIDCAKMTNEELIASLKALVAREREDVALIVDHLKEFEKRELSFELGQPSLFEYCTRVLGYSEGAAFKRIRAARAAKKFPAVLSMLKSGELSLGSIASLHPHLNEALLERARGKTTREVEAMVAEISPNPVASDCIRRLGPAPQKPAEPVVPDLFNEPNAPEAIAPSVVPAEQSPKEQLIRFAFTGTEALHARIQRARELLKHKFPEGNLQDLVWEAMELFLDRKDPERRLKRLAGLKRARQEQASVETRRIPQGVKDQVWKRDEGRCAYIAPEGGRCPATGGLEFDHIVPWALGGRSGDPKNIRLLCRGHNQWRARRRFGPSSGKKVL